MLEQEPGSLTRWLAAGGEPAYRAGQILQWVYGHGVEHFAAMTNLSRALRERLEASTRIYLSTVERSLAGDDGTRKLLLRWPDGRHSECVLIAEGRRRTACISTQVGCPVRCAFCASGLGGLEANLTAGQIVEQAMRVRQLVPPPDRLTHVVFMGIGEPLANYEATLSAVRTINAGWGMDIGARWLTVSTIGLPDRVRRLADERLQITLAISIHAPTDALRRELIPWAGRIRLAEIVAAARYYFERTGREVTFEYVLLASVNDRQTHAEQLARLARQVRCNVNLIRYNPVPALPYERPSEAATRRFMDILRRKGVNVHVRRSRGLGIQAACGQLRQEAEPAS